MNLWMHLTIVMLGTLRLSLPFFSAVVSLIYQVTKSVQKCTMTSYSLSPMQNYLGQDCELMSGGSLEGVHSYSQVGEGIR